MVALTATFQQVAKKTTWFKPVVNRVAKVVDMVVSRICGLTVVGDGTARSDLVAVVCGTGVIQKAMEDARKNMRRAPLNGGTRTRHHGAPRGVGAHAACICRPSSRRCDGAVFECPARDAGETYPHQQPD